MALTKKDIEKLTDVFATKDDLARLATKEEMNARFDQVTKTLDWLVGKVQSISDELKINFAQYRRHDEKLEDHEKRIKTLETKVLIT